MQRTKVVPALPVVGDCAAHDFGLQPSRRGRTDPPALREIHGSPCHNHGGVHRASDANLDAHADPTPIFRHDR